MQGLEISEEKFHETKKIFRESNKQLSSNPLCPSITGYTIRQIDGMIKSFLNHSMPEGYRMSHTQPSEDGSIIMVIYKYKEGEKPFEPTVFRYFLLSLEDV